jgi:hypothetical protein
MSVYSTRGTNPFENEMGTIMQEVDRVKLRRLRRAAFALLALIGIAGCRAIQVKLGMKVPLAKIQATSMEASQAKSPGIAPGQKSSLIVTVTDAAGKQWETEGAGKGKILWSDLAVTATVVSDNKKGVLSLPRDPRASDGKTGHVTVTAPSHPDLHADLDIPLRYNVKFSANFSGTSGSNGLDGSSGSDGSDGSPGSLDPDNPSPGGNGSDGTNGGDGGDGGRGGDAPAVQIWLTVRPGDPPLLQAGVLAQGHKERYYLVDPNGGSLSVAADGGAGGSGGKGGRGGRGGSGGVGSPNGTSGRDGLDGHDGMSGMAGNGGQITAFYDPSVQPYLGVIHLSSAYGPKPKMQEEAVSPLW